MKKLILSALLALAFCAPARAGNPTPLTVQIDRSQNPSPICFNRLTSASGCQTVIGYVDSSNVWTPLGPGSIPFPASFSIDTTDAGNITKGTLACPRQAAQTGDVTSPAGSCVHTLAAVNSDVGTYGDAGTTVTITVDAKGRILAVSTNSIQAPAGQLTGSALAPGVTQSSLTQVGTIIAGTWQGTPLATAYIADQAVTPAKLAPSANLTIRSNISGGSASPADNTLTNILDAVFGSTQGQVICRGASGWETITGGTSGYALSGNGAGACPSYQAPATAAVPRGYIAGLTLANDGTLPNTVLDVSVGQATSDDASTFMALGSAYTKSTSSWAVGSGNGALDTGTIAANTWYHVFLIERTDTQVVDLLLSTSATSPTLPTNYTKKRRIGAIRTNASSQITPFSQYGDEFLWTTTVNDINTTTLSNSTVPFTLTVPPGVTVNARVRGYVSSATASASVTVSSPAESVTGTGLGQNIIVPIANGFGAAELSVRTNTSAQINAIAGSPSTTLKLFTFGWVDTRGKWN